MCIAEKLCKEFAITTLHSYPARKTPAMKPQPLTEEHLPAAVALAAAAFADSIAYVSI